eukprot:jgi/Botrbrau1/5647/Bobra.55_1s0035.1
MAKTIANPSCDHIVAWDQESGRGVDRDERVGALRSCIARYFTGKLGSKVGGSAPTQEYVCVECAACAETCEALGGTQCASASSGHRFILDVERLELYCSKCKDYVYDPAFDKAVWLATQQTLASRQRLPKDSKPHPILQQIRARTGAGCLNGCLSSEPVPPQSRNPRGTGAPACGETETRELLPTGLALPLPRIQGIPDGLRGIANTGSTCYMNAVLQALLHTAPLMRYCLGGGHPLKTCPTRQRMEQCMPCELVKLFSDVYDGQRSAIDPVVFQAAWFAVVKDVNEEMATSQQHDAHEFYMLLLFALSSALLPPQDGGRCMPEDSIVQHLFGGVLRSDVTCEACGYLSVAYDPFNDISVNFNQAHSSPRRKHVPGPPRGRGGGRRPGRSPYSDRQARDSSVGTPEPLFALPEAEGAASREESAGPAVPAALSPSQSPKIEAPTVSMPNGVASDSAAYQQALANGVTEARWASKRQQGPPTPAALQGQQDRAQDPSRLWSPAGSCPTWLVPTASAAASAAAASASAVAAAAAAAAAAVAAESAAAVAAASAAAATTPCGGVASPNADTAAPEFPAGKCWGSPGQQHVGGVQSPWDESPWV